jgi:hypothetical protein
MKPQKRPVILRRVADPYEISNRWDLLGEPIPHDGFLQFLRRDDFSEVMHVRHFSFHKVIRRHGDEILPRDETATKVKRCMESCRL